MNVNPRVSLKNGILTVALLKAQDRTLRDAQAICRMISTLSPVDPRVQDHARQAEVHIGCVLAMCSKVEAAESGRAT